MPIACRLPVCVRERRTTLQRSKSRRNALTSICIVRRPHKEIKHAEPARTRWSLPAVIGGAPRRRLCEALVTLTTETVSGSTLAVSPLRRIGGGTITCFPSGPGRARIGRSVARPYEGDGRGGGEVGVGEVAATRDRNCEMLQEVL